MKKLGLPLISGLVVALMAFVGVFLPFGAGIHEYANVTGLGSADALVEGFYMIFGRPETSDNGSMPIVAGLLIAYLFVVLALFAAVGGIVLTVLKKDQEVMKFSLSNILYAVAGLLMVIAAILFFCGKPMTLKTWDVSDSSGIGGSLTFKLGVAFVFEGILDLIGGACGFVGLCLPFFSKKK